MALWLCGPPGVGKTAVGWEVYSRLPNAAFVDVDQLGMCYPERSGDPGRYRLQARNLRAVLANFHAAGAENVVVSGVVDAVNMVHREEIPAGAVTVCRLYASREEIVRRLGMRGEPAEVVAEALRAAELLDASDVADLAIDTTGRAVAEVAGQVCASMRPSERVPVPAVASGHGGILWLYGPTGVGKSTVGFQLYQEILRGGRTAAYVDSRQIGFCEGAVTSRNLAAVWGNFRAEVTVVVGSREDLAACAAVLPVVPLGLRASAGTVAERIMSRGRGQGWHEPGDPLKGQPVEVLRHVIDGAVAETVDGDPCFDTDGRTPGDITRMILDWVSKEVGQWSAFGPGIAGGWHEQVCPGDPRES